MLMAPPWPLVAAPVCSAMKPVDPTLDVPVKTNTPPDMPADAAVALEITTDPDPLLKLDPDVMDTAPPAPDPVAHPPTTLTMPPTTAAALPMPPAMLTTPAPEPELLAPATMLMAPPRAPVAVPPSNTIVPLFADAAVPVLRVMLPDTNAPMEFADTMDTDPDPLLLEVPEDSTTAPPSPAPAAPPPCTLTVPPAPVVPDTAPALMSTAPPVPAGPLPTTILMLPPRFTDDVPVCSTIAPVLLVAEAPDLSVTTPDCPKLVTSAVEISTDPDPELKLDPLVASTLPPIPATRDDCPAISTTLPPLLLFPLPTTTLMLPPRPPVAVPL